MIDDMDWFINNLREKVPFGFARFNDGEMMGIANAGCIVARGDQHVDGTLSLSLRDALGYKQSNYYIGIPCSLCYPEHHTLATEIVGDYDFLTRAVVTTNRNWKRFISEFPEAMASQRLIWISGNDQNINGLKALGLNLAKTALIPRKNSWTFYDQIKEMMPQYFEPGDVVGISLGPSARVLVRQWFEEYPDITFIDMGSNLDPVTRNVYHNCHKGWDETGFNLAKRCPECN